MTEPTEAEQSEAPAPNKADEVFAKHDPEPAADEVMRIELDQFEGPFEVLLYLIKSQELDIFDIPILQITLPQPRSARRCERWRRVAMPATRVWSARTSGCWHSACPTAPGRRGEPAGCMGTWPATGGWHTRAGGVAPIPPAV